MNNINRNNKIEYNLLQQFYDDLLIDKYSISFYNIFIQPLMISIKQPANLLDLGCGTGTLLLEASKTNLFNLLYGIDLSKKMISLAKKKYLKIIERK